MSHLGMLSFPGTGHLHPLTALGRQLERRGHQITVFQVADAETLVRAAGLGFSPIGSADFPLGSLRAQDQCLGRLQGTKALGFIFERFCRHSAVVLRDAPHAMRAAGIDALIVDCAEFAGGTVAERLGLPFVTVILTLPLNLDPEVPFCGFHAGLERSVGARLRTAAGNARVRALASGLCGLVTGQRQAWGLQPKTSLDSFYWTWRRLRRCPRALIFPNAICRPSSITPGRFWTQAPGVQWLFPGSAWIPAGRWFLSLWVRCKTGWSASFGLCPRRARSSRCKRCSLWAAI